MKEARQNVQTEAWDRLVHERVSEPLRPERLRSLLVIVPAASGDVALATTVIRHVKDINPACRIIFATESGNIALVKMCPGVDQTIELPGVARFREGQTSDKKVLSRRRSLSEYSGRADAVIYTNWYPEDRDLLKEQQFNMLESVWLLAGVTGGMPSGTHRVWLESPSAASEAFTTIQRTLSNGARCALFVRAVKRFPESLAAIVRSRSLKGSRITLVPKELYNLTVSWAETLKAVHRRRLQASSLSRNFVILCTESKSIPPPARGMVRTLVEMLRQDGRTVLQNVLDPSHADLGTVPLVCTYEEFVGLRQAGIPFVGWRSGLCDVAAASRAPMCVFSPPESAWCQDVQATFGFNAMGIDADCLEIVCRDVRDIKESNFVAHLSATKVK